MDNKIDIRRSQKFKTVAIIATAGLIGLISYLSTGCREQEAKPYEAVQNNAVAETTQQETVETPYETNSTVTETTQEPKTIDDIISYSTDKDMFGLDADPSNIAVSADPAKMDRIKKIVYSAVSKYPDNFLVENLDRIYILSKLGSGDTKNNGSYHPLLKRVYVVMNPEPGRGDDNVIESIFHSEISSILLEPHLNFETGEERYSKYFDEKAWKAVNPDFKYLNISSYDAVKAGFNCNLDPDLFDEGLLSTYSTSNLEEDFNLFAGYMLTDYEPFWTAVKEHDRLRQKLDLTSKFYITLDKEFEPILKQQYEAHGLEWSGA